MSSNNTSEIHSGTNAGSASTLLQHRIIAVWALAEGILGGIFHGLHIPVTGLIIGSISVCCLSLLSQLAQHKGSLLKATLLVLLIKAMLSPHSPPGAYIAVFSQGFLAELLFRGLKRYKLNCYLLGILTQLQSALQHLITLTLVFGTDFWPALDIFLNKISGSIGLTGVSYAVYFAWAYLGLHALVGVLMGWIAGNLPNWLPKQNALTIPYTINKTEAPETLISKKPEKPKMKLRLGLVVIWFVLVIVFLQSYFHIGPALLPQGKIIQLLIRSVLVVSIWYFVVSPVLLRLLHKWLQKKRGLLQQELAAILEMLPETKALIKQTWKESAGQTGLVRLKTFIKLTSYALFTLPA